MPNQPKYDTSEKPQVPLQVAWLSENDLLVRAAALLGYTFELTDGKPKSANTEGVTMQVPAGPVHTTSGTRKGLSNLTLGWDDHMLFTLDQLAKLGFATGDDADALVCPDCHRTRDVCDAERRAIAEHNQD